MTLSFWKTHQNRPKPALSLLDPRDQGLQSPLGFKNKGLWGPWRCVAKMAKLGRLWARLLPQARQRHIYRATTDETNGRPAEEILYDYRPKEGTTTRPAAGRRRGVGASIPLGRWPPKGGNSTAEALPKARGLQPHMECALQLGAPSLGRSVPIAFHFEGQWALLSGQPEGCGK